jgi:cysteine synthase A
MSDVTQDILQCIGNTSLLALRHIVPASGARLLLKLESENPTGTMKDRMALAMIAEAEKDGRLASGGSVVEYTGGSTGVSLALICAVKGYPLHIVTSDAFAREKLDHMRILGARLEIVKSESGRMTETLTRDMIEAARIVALETGAFWTDQMKNTDQLAAYRDLAAEIWRQTGGRIDGFVQSVGTAASLRGTGEALRRRKQGISIVAVEPTESPVLSGGKPGAHKIEGSARASSCRSGRTASPTASSLSRLRRPRRWRFASPARKASSPAPPPAPTSSPPCASPSGWGRARRSSQ